MSRDLEVGLTLRMRDQASTPSQQAERNVQRNVRQTERTYVDASRVAVSTSRMLYDVRMGQSSRAEQAVQREVQQTEAAYVRANRNILTSSQRLANAREQLETRSDQAIRRELDQTVSAYNRLYRAGFSSAAEQARAFGKLRERVAELNRELRGTERAESFLARGKRGMGGLWNAGSAIAGGAAGAMVVSPAIHQAMDYDRRLAMMANTAFSDRDVAGRKRGVAELNNAIVGAVRAGGGSREKAADTLDNLLASGAVSDKTAMQLLPTLQKFSTATGADPNELGNIAIRAMQNFGIKETDIPRALDMALKGGQAGGFELRDMSKWLPQQMSLAKTAGMSGLTDFGKLVVANQASVITAGTKDEAGNNLVNLLEKLNSADTQLKAKHLGIDLTGSLASSRVKGVNALDAFVGIVQTVMAKDGRYQRTQAQLAKAPEGERKDILASQASLLEGTAIGKLIHDRQALAALVAYMGQADYRKQVATQVFDSKSAVDSNFDLISQTASFKTEQLGNERTFARQDALGGLDKAIGDAASSLTQYARKYPGVTTAIEGAKIALTSLTAAAGAAATVQFLRGGLTASGAGGAAVDAENAAAAEAGALGASGGRAASLAAGVARGVKVGGMLGVPLQLAASGFEVYSIAHDDSLSADQKKAGYVGVGGGAVGGIGGMLAGAAVGGAIGTAGFPVVGTIAGVVGGAIAGYFGHDFGEKIGKQIGDVIFSQKKADKPPVVESHITLNLDGQHLYDFITTSGQQAALRR